MERNNQDWESLVIGPEIILVGVRVRRFQVDSESVPLAASADWPTGDSVWRAAGGRARPTAAAAAVAATAATQRDTE